jgi:hypothetical protein
MYDNISYFATFMELKQDINIIAFIYTLFLFLLCSGYVVTFTIFFTIYYSLIHPLHHSPLSLIPPFLPQFTLIVKYCFHVMQTRETVIIFSI